MYLHARNYKRLIGFYRFTDIFYFVFCLRFTIVFDSISPIVGVISQLSLVIYVLKVLSFFLLEIWVALVPFCGASCLEHSDSKLSAGVVIYIAV